MGVASESAFPFASTKLATSPRFCSSISRRIFSDVVGDVTISVDGQSFLLHKFPLVSRSGKIRKMVVESKDTDLSMLELFKVPGGAPAFELAAKFCYGTNFEITTSNVAHLRCIAEYLEMTEDYQEENLIARTETYLNEIVVQSLEKSIEVLCASEGLHPTVDELGILDRCVDAIAINASKEQLVSGLACLECDAGSGKLKMDGQDWWVEDLSVLRLDLYQRVVAAMRRTGVRSDSITTSIVHYAQTSLKGVERYQAWDSSTFVGGKQRVIIETLVGLLATEKITSVPLSFLFGMLRMAIEVDAGRGCRLELERRIGFQLEMASLDDLLIPSLQTNDSVFDVDTVHHILVTFLQRIEDEDSEELLQCGYESEGLKSPSHSSVLKVGRLMDGYLAEIAPDPYLKLQKFMAIIELLPDYARIIDDGLYRAIDIYLKAHPSMTESECKKLCKLIDCQKLSQEASNHAAQNDRLPVGLVVRVLYLEQLHLKSALSGNSVDRSLSQRMIGSSGAPSSAVSPRDNYACLRRENRELKLEISRMRVRLSELEKEQAFMKQGMRDGRSGERSRAFLASLSRGIGRIAMIAPATGKQSQASDGKRRRRHKHSVS
ncbi:BTB/POZ domain-containing protein At3g08570-like [Phoenix dactylifera]|uniref:BTB/POZ domain-containing protein At3g08570-like n=1 Tax=Phoenix dactylifera TaxID=42345 RepID=A0A8B7BYN7_PHODC|nr:BTB/POZ domain-containing protein At3g08570-like [Phoenix dactylifera]